MKTTVTVIYWINKVLFPLAFLLYMTIFLGALLEIVLGVFQLVSFLILSFFSRRISDNHKKKLFNYFVFLVVYGVLIFLLYHFDTQEELSFVIIFFICLPFLMAYYFTIMISEIYKSYE